MFVADIVHGGYETVLQVTIRRWSDVVVHNRFVGRGPACHTARGVSPIAPPTIAETSVVQRGDDDDLEEQ